MDARAEVRPANTRKKRDPVAVDNVRRCRQLAKTAAEARENFRPMEFLAKRAASNAERQRRFRERVALEKEKGARMALRWWPMCPAPHIICLRYEYWQALACGWNPLAKEIARDEHRRPIDPAIGAAWLWWTGLDRHSRAWVVQDNRIHLTRPGGTHP